MKIKKSSLTMFFAASVLLLAIVLILFTKPRDMHKPGSPDKNQGDTASNTMPNSPLSFDVAAVPVKVVIAWKGTLIKRITATGIVKASKDVDVIPRITGEIKDLPVAEGQFVHKGDLLLRLDDREYQIACKEAEHRLLDAQIEYGLMKSGAVPFRRDTARSATLIDAKQRFEQAEKAYHQGQITEQEYQRARRDYEVALTFSSVNREDVVANKSGLNQAQQAVERGKLNLSYTEIRAPFSGVVANCSDLVVGGTVQAGKSYCKLADISKLRLEVGVLESEIRLIQVGRKAEIALPAYPEEKFVGKTVTISPIVDTESKTCKVMIESNNPAGKIKPGMFAQARLDAEIYTNRLLVPKEALLVRDQRKLVFTVEGDLAKWCYVETGLESDEYVEIKSGIAEGDTVIVSGHYTLSHDAKIHIMN